MATVSEFKFYFISMHLNKHMWLIVTVLDNGALKPCTKNNFWLNE